MKHRNKLATPPIYECAAGALRYRCLKSQP